MTTCGTRGEPLIVTRSRRQRLFATKSEQHQRRPSVHCPLLFSISYKRRRAGQCLTETRRFHAGLLQPATRRSLSASSMIYTCKPLAHNWSAHPLKDARKGERMSTFTNDRQTHSERQSNELNDFVPYA